MDVRVCAPFFTCYIMEKSMKSKLELIKWETPFSNAPYPSIGIITEQLGESAKLLVAPHGIDMFPKYLVSFENVYFMLYYEEAYSFDRGYKNLNREVDGLCSYKWVDSPWLKEYSQGQDIFGWNELTHHLIFGGDNIVEIISDCEPKIEIIEKSIIIEIKHII